MLILLLFVPAVGGSCVQSSQGKVARKQLLQQENMDTEMKTLEQPWQQLLKAEEVEGAKAWGEVLFNIPAAREFVAQVSKEAVPLVLSQGQKCNGMGWTTSRASIVVYELTGVPLVSSRWRSIETRFCLL